MFEYKHLPLDLEQLFWENFNGIFREINLILSVFMKVLAKDTRNIKMNAAEKA